MISGHLTIVGTGHHVPGQPVPNSALTRVMNTNDAWIRKRTGIAQRHFAAPSEGPTDLAVPAAQRALADAGLSAQDVDYVIFATMTPETFIPGPGAMFTAKLGIPGVPALDIRQQCAAIPFALQLADGLLRSGAANTILLLGAETHAHFMPWKNWAALLDEKAPIDERDYARASEHRGYAVVFGDGAGAMVLQRAKEEGRGLLGTRLRSDGRDAGFLQMAAPWWQELEALTPDERFARLLPVMNGPGLFKRAVRELPQLVLKLCEDTGVAPEEISWFLAHQANERINEGVRQALNLPAEKMPTNIARYGNTSAGTIPILLDEQRRSGALRSGDLVCLLALGAGLHYGTSLLRL